MSQSDVTVEAHGKRDIAFTDGFHVGRKKSKIQKVKVKDVRFCVFISKMHGPGRILSTSLFFFSCFYLCQGFLYLLVLFLTIFPFMLVPLILCK